MDAEKQMELKEAVQNGFAQAAQDLVREGLKAGISAQELVEEALLPAMRCAGEDFRNQEGDIARILAAARSMRKCLDVLEPYLARMEEDSQMGTVVLGTVKGDLHDVGKNLVATMFRIEGFRVVDLGVDVPEKTFVQALRDHPEASFACISSLLTTTMSQMERTVRAIRKARDLKHVQIMVGGGSVDAVFAAQIGADYYTENAVDAALTASKIVLAGKEEQGRRES